MSGPLRRRARQHWHELTEAEKRAAVRNMALFGHSPATISAATGLSIEAIRAILGEHKAAERAG